MNNNIYIIGYGAIGKVLAVLLKLNNKKVIILRGSIDDNSKSTETVRITLNEKVLEAEIEINTLSNFSELNGLIVLANKSYGNQRLSPILKNKIKASPIVILQNGLGVEQVFIDNNFSEIYRCVLFATSQNTRSNNVQFKPVSASPIGIVKGNSATLNLIAEQLSTSDFLFRTETDIQSIAWKKTIANCVFNSICPLLETDNGIFYREKYALEVAKKIVAECNTIAKESGILLNDDDIINGILQISKSSEGQLISTYQDILNKRETEIDTMNLEIARIAESFGKGHLVKETKLLGELIKLKSGLSISSIGINH